MKELRTYFIYRDLKPIGEYNFYFIPGDEKHNKNVSRIEDKLLKLCKKSKLKFTVASTIIKEE